MKSIIAKTAENVEFVISIDNIDNDRVNVYLNGINLKTNAVGNVFPSFYMEHTKFHVKLDFEEIFKVIDYGITYHFHWNEDSKKEIENWILTNIKNSFF